MNPIVVGVDGSTASESALDWAAEQAQLSGAQLRIVLVRPHPIPVTAMAPVPVWPWPVIHQRNEQDVAEAKAMLAIIVAATIPAADELDIEIDVIDGPTGSSLIEVATQVEASMIVVGRRGIGGFKRLLLGSVSEEVSTYAPCPVVIAQSNSLRSDPVVLVGVDGSTGGDLAFRWAAAQARVTKSRLHVVLTWEPPQVAPDSLAGSLQSIGPDLDELEARERSLLADVLARCAQDLVGVNVTPELRTGYASEQLTQAASELHARLLVVGSRGLGGFSSMLVGSVAHQCLRHANCPVAVVRAGPWRARWLSEFGLIPTLGESAIPPPTPV